MKDSNWYFRDWNESKQVDSATGRHKTVYTYVGAYWMLPLPKKKWLLLHIALYVIFLASLSLLIFHPSAGGMSKQVGPLCILALAPSIFWILGLGNQCFSPVNMTYRDYYQSFRRSRWSCIAATAVMTLTLVFEIRYIFINGVSGELYFLFILLVAFGCSCTAAIHCVKFPCKNIGTADSIAKENVK